MYVPQEIDTLLCVAAVVCEDGQVPSEASLCPAPGPGLGSVLELRQEHGIQDHRGDPRRQQGQQTSHGTHTANRIPL